MLVGNLAPKFGACHLDAFGRCSDLWCARREPARHRSGLLLHQRAQVAYGPCPSSKMRLTTKVRVSNGSGGSVSGICRSKSVACNGVLRPCYVPRVDLFMPLNNICSIAK